MESIRYARYAGTGDQNVVAVADGGYGARVFLVLEEPGGDRGDVVPCDGRTQLSVPKFWWDRRWFTRRLVPSGELNPPIADGAEAVDAQFDLVPRCGFCDYVEQGVR